MNKSNFSKKMSVWKSIMSLCISLLFCSTMAFAQSITVTGTVSDETGDSMPGVNVTVKGTTTGVITDTNGKYSITAPNRDAVLVFSFVGYVAQEFVVGDQHAINVTLLEDTREIEEVVVVGYGVQKKKLVTGATVEIKSEDIAKMNAVGVAGSLQGQTPGVNIMQTSGEPGDNFKVSIRGVGTTGNYSPLYIIDGFPGGINTVDPANIERIDILKDAASAAIYGSRAANGVVLITTKKGAEGKARIAYDGNVGFEYLRYKPEMLDAKQYIDIMNKAGNYAPDYFENLLSIYPGWYESIMDGTNKGTDWINEGYNKGAFNQTHNISVSGGTKQSIYNVAFTYTDAEGMLGKPVLPTYKRKTVMINSEHTVLRSRLDRPIIKVGENLTFTNSSSNGLVYGIAGNNQMRTYLLAPPILPVYEEDGSYTMPIPGWEETEGFNPLAQIKALNSGEEDTANTFNLNSYITIEPIKNLVWRTSYSHRFATTNNRKWTPAYKFSANRMQNYDLVHQDMSQTTNWMAESTLSYTHYFGKHQLDGLFGLSFEENGGRLFISGENSNPIFDDFEHAYLNNTAPLHPTYAKIGGGPSGSNGNSVRTATESFFGRLNYGYADKYLLTGILRYDGSSKFMRGHRWGLFPSISAGWVPTEERFMEPVKKWFNFFKLRASYGENGNQRISDFQYLATVAYGDAGANKLNYYMFDPTKQNLTTGAYFDLTENPVVTWETSIQSNIGFDARFLNNRLIAAFDWYRKVTSDWLVNPPTLATYGNPSAYINGGDVLNTGVEFSLGWRDKVKDFTYNVNVNGSSNRNEVTRIANDEGVIHGGTTGLFNQASEFYRAQVGYPIGFFYGYKTLGVFQNQEQIDAYLNADGNKIQPGAEPGDLIFTDSNGDGKINDDDKVQIGNPYPGFTLGVNINLAWKGFDFALVGYGAFGHQIVSVYNDPGYLRRNWSKELYEQCWYGEDTSNKYPKPVIINTDSWKNISDIYIKNGDYFRISVVTLGYDFATLFKNKNTFGQLRAYVSGQNLLCFTKYNGFDPEVGANFGPSWTAGIDNGFYPRPLTILFGLSIKY